MVKFAFLLFMKVEIANSVKGLIEGKTLLYPTDTVWGLGCDATNFEAVQKIYKLKERSESKSLIVLVDSLEMLSIYIDKISEDIKAVLGESNRPTTIIYNKPQGLAENAVAKDNTVAIRIVKDDFCEELIKKFGKPIISTSANVSGRPTPYSYKEIEPAILQNVDYKVNLHRDKKSKIPSRILKLELDGKITIIRE